MLTQKKAFVVTRAVEAITNLFENRSCTIGVDEDQVDGQLSIGIFIGDDLIGYSSPILLPEFFPDFKKEGINPEVEYSASAPPEIDDIMTVLFRAFCERMNQHLMPFTLRLEIKETKDQLIKDLSNHYLASRTFQEALVELEVTPVISWKNKLAPTEFEDSVPIARLLTDEEFDRLVDMGTNQHTVPSSTGGFGFITGGHITP